MRRSAVRFRSRAPGQDRLAGTSPRPTHVAARPRRLLDRPGPRAPAGRALLLRRRNRGLLCDDYHLAMTRQGRLDDATAEALLAGGGPPELAHVAAFLEALRAEGTGAIPRPSSALSSLLASAPAPISPTVQADVGGAEVAGPMAHPRLPSTGPRLARLTAGLAGASMVAKASISGVALAAAVTMAGAAGVPVAEGVVDAVVDLVAGRDRQENPRTTRDRRGDAEVARARTHAEQRRVEAEQRRTDAEQRRTDAADAERRAQLLRAEAEQRRARAEQARADAARIGDEAGAAAAETAEQRARADEQRATADQLRAEAERREAEADEQRAEAEELQAEAELRRVEPGSGSAPAGTPSPTDPPRPATASTSPPPAAATSRP